MWAKWWLRFAGVCLASLLGFASQAPAAVFGPDVAQRFAPVVRLAAGEKTLPASAQWFLDRASLQWHNDDGCRTDLFHPVQVWSTGDLNALGNGGYSTKSRDKNCQKAGPRYTTRDRTRPTDRHRPSGLTATDGFFLDLIDSSDVRWGIKDTTPEDPQLYTGAPVYYESGDIAKPGASSGEYMYLTYWFFYAFNDGPSGQNHEGDWEGMSILFGETSPGHYRPRALALNQHSGTQEIPWRSRRFAGQRAVVYSAKGTHATYDHDGAFRIGPFVETVGGGPDWDTSLSVLPLYDQPWAGYCGGWGQVGRLARVPTPLGRGDTTGPLGPGCLVNGRSIKDAIPDGWGPPALRKPGAQPIAVVDPVSGPTVP